MIPNTQNRLLPPLTPFLEKILSLVAVTCKPQVMGWEEVLQKKLQEEFYACFGPGEELRSERLNNLHFRLLEMEKKLSTAPTRDPGLGEHPNFRDSRSHFEIKEIGS